MSESQEQQAVVAYFKAKHPKHALLISASANGAHIAGNKHQRMLKIVKMKREGMLPGMPDLSINVPKGGFTGLFIEMKDVGKTKCSVSKEQRAVMDALNENGGKAIWCPGASAAIYQIDKYMRLKKIK